MNISSNINKLSSTDCILYRFIGSLLLITSTINLFITFRYLLKRYYNRDKEYIPNRLSSIMIGMSISSILVIFAAVPVVVAQCFSCQSYLNNNIFCKIHGFICFSNGIFNMYIVALLSFSRYFSILHKSNWFNKYLQHYRDMSVLVCGLISIIWSTPSFFNIGNRYIREDLGFYCSLKWDDPSIYARIFVISLISFNYMIPFLLVIYSNLRVWCTLRYLILKSTEHSTYALSTIGVISSRSSLNRLQRLKIDQRYAFLTAIIATQYLIIWTPYAFIVILKFLGKTTFIQHHFFLPTLFALFAKISLVLNPIILIYTSKMTPSS